MGVHLILTGGTGLVGLSVISHILSLPAGITATSQTISKLTVLTRNPHVPLLATNPPKGTPSANKVTQIEILEHKDFNVYPDELLAKLKGADACIWALGISQSEVSRDEYITITKDYALNAAQAFAKLRIGKTSSSTTTSSSPGSRDGEPQDIDANKFKFIYISGEGATLTPRPWTPLFGRVKGETEASLLALSKSPAFKDSLAVYSARPGGVDGGNQPWLWHEILQNKRSTGMRLMGTYLVPVMRVVFRPLMSPTESLGKVLVEMACDESRGAYDGKGVDGEGRTLANVKLRSLGGL